METDETADFLVVLCSAAVPGEYIGPAFVETTRNLGASKLFLTDPNSAMYVQGLPGMGDGLEQIAQAIEAVQRRIGARSTIFVGSSSGGFAAMILGTLVGAQTVLAFNPPTLLNRREFFQEVKLFHHLQQNRALTASIQDVPQFLRTQLSSATRVFVMYSAWDTIDNLRTQILVGIPGVHVIGFPFIRHDLARWLARNGWVRRMLDAAISGVDGALESSITRSRLAAYVNLPVLLTRWMFRRAHA